ncbi:hypothetical protein ACFL5K_01330 [Gemmatimonadota bacterium]
MSDNNNIIHIKRQLWGCRLGRTSVPYANRNKYASRFEECPGYEKNAGAVETIGFSNIPGDKKSFYFRIGCYIIL